jgi:dTMP kinase
MFVTLEGIDGSGKTTVVKILKGLLEANGIPVQMTRTPGGVDEVGRRVRQFLLDPELSVARRAQPLFFLADMLQLEQILIRPAIERGEVVLCDRYKDSTWVYQVATNSQLSLYERQAIETLMNCNLLNPDITFILGLPLDVARDRLDTGEFGKEDTYENASRQKWMQRWEAYQALPGLIHNRGRRFDVIEVSKMGPEEVAAILEDRIVESYVERRNEV